MPTKRKKPKLHPAEQYIEDVISGKQIACKWTILACKRQKHDLKHGAKRGLIFDRDAAQHAIDFYSFLHHSKGEWAGTVIKLEPWQQFTLWVVFGWKHKKTGYRRFKVGYETEARKNGKSTKLSGTGLYGLTADGEEGAEIYTAATMREQARIIHGEAVRMRNRSPSIKRMVGYTKDNLHVIDTNSKFTPLGADKDTMDGLNVHMALIDELHAHKTRGIWDLLDTATGSRKQPLVWAITTAGSDKSERSVCWEQQKYSQRLLEGFDQPDGLKDDSYFAFIYTLDEDDDPFDEKNWVKANPNLGVSVDIDDLRRKAIRAKETNGAYNTFLRLHMNVWTDALTVWIPAAKWNACRQEFSEHDLKGQDCYGALDLSTVKDLAAFGLIFPRDEVVMIDNPMIDPEDDESPEQIEIAVKFYRYLAWYWIPEVNAESRTRRDRVLYKSWVDQEFIKDTIGDVIDYDTIRNDICTLGEKFNILQIGYDRWNSSQIVTQLQGDGFEMIPFGQGFSSMSAPTKEMEKLVLARRFEHNGHPVTTWCVGNTQTKTDAAGNVKPDKEKSTEKIDGAVCAIMALGVAILDPENRKSVYSKRGLRTT